MAYNAPFETLELKKAPGTNKLTLFCPNDKINSERQGSGLFKETPNFHNFLQIIKTYATMPLITIDH